MTDNKPTEYCLSPADTPKDTKGTPASDLRVTPNPDAPKHTAAPEKPLREQLREAETMYKYKHKRRSWKLFWYLYRIYFTILGLLIFFYCVGATTDPTLTDYLLIALESAGIGATTALIPALVGMPIWYGAYTNCFANEFDDLYKIESIKDRMGES